MENQVAIPFKGKDLWSPTIIFGDELLNFGGVVKSGMIGAEYFVPLFVLFFFPNAHRLPSVFSRWFAHRGHEISEAMDLLKSGWEYLDIRRLEEAGPRGPLGVFLLV